MPLTMPREIWLIFKHYGAKRRWIACNGTGTQEQFINYLSETPQYKNVEAKESTSNKMSDERIEFVTAQFN
jgi:hypothetical protein